LEIADVSMKRSIEAVSHVSEEKSETSERQ
jgi:hypothetical protein